MATKTRTRRRQAPVSPADEDARQRFLRIGQPRMNRALSAIALLGNMSAPQYEWSEPDVLHIKTTLMIAVTEMLERFEVKLRIKARRPAFHFEGVTKAPSDEEVLGLAGPNGRGRLATPAKN